MELSIELHAELRRVIDLLTKPDETVFDLRTARRLRDIALIDCKLTPVEPVQASMKPSSPEEAQQVADQRFGDKKVICGDWMIFVGRIIFTRHIGKLMIGIDNRFNHARELDAQERYIIVLDRKNGEPEHFLKTRTKEYIFGKHTIFWPRYPVFKHRSPAPAPLQSRH